MESTLKFWNELTSLYWWLSVFAVGLALNLLAAYLKPGLDGFLSKCSESARSKSVRRAEKFETDTLELMRNPQLLQLEALYEIRTRIRIVFFFIASTGLIFMSHFISEHAKADPSAFKWLLVIISSGLSTLTIVWTYQMLVVASECRAIIDAANERIATLLASSSDPPYVSQVGSRRRFNR